MNSQKGGNKYVPNLQKLQAVCARNYALLMRLLPLEYKVLDTWSLCLADKLTYRLTVESSSPYTETMRLVQSNDSMPKFMATEIEFRVYHDAQMVEVIGFQKQTRLRQNYPYPNPKLHQKDEKMQVNTLLKDWLNLVVNTQNEKQGQPSLLSSSI